MPCTRCSCTSCVTYYERPVFDAVNLKIIQLVGEGWEEQEIRNSLGLTRPAFKGRVSKIYRRLRIPNDRHGYVVLGVWAQCPLFALGLEELVDAERLRRHQEKPRKGAS